MHKHIESIWNFKHHHIKENTSLLLKVGIFILPSLLPSPLLFHIYHSSILFYLSLPGRDPVSLNIRRHLHSDPGSIVKVFQHMMTL